MSCLMEAMGCQRSLSFCLTLTCAQTESTCTCTKGYSRNLLLPLFYFLRPKFNLPAKILSSAALFSNMMYHKLGLQILSSPLLHPDMVYFLSCTRTLSISRARKLLGYHPIVSLEVSSFRPCSIDNHSFHLVFSIYFAFYSFWRSIFIVDLFIFSKKPVSVFSLTLMLIYHSFDAWCACRMASWELLDHYQNYQISWICPGKEALLDHQKQRSC